MTSRKNTERDRQITAIARGYLDLAVHKRDYRTWYQDTWEAIEQFEKSRRRHGVGDAGKSMAVREP